MMNLQQTRVIDPILTDFVRGYSNNEMVGGLLFPRVEVYASGGQVIEFGKEAFQIYDTKRAPGSMTKRIELGYLGRPFALEIHGLDALVPYESMRDAAAVPHIDLARAAIEEVADSMTLRTEYDQAALATTAANYPTSNVLALTTGANFSTNTLDPNTIVQQARQGIRAGTGKYPNVMILPPNAVFALKQNQFIRDQFKYTTPDSITLAMLAAYFEVETVVEGNAVFTTASAANSATPFSNVWGNNIVLAYVPKGFRGQKVPSYGYTYSMTGEPSVEAPYQERSRRSWVYGVNFSRVPVIAGQTSGFLIQNAF